MKPNEVGLLSDQETQSKDQNTLEGLHFQSALGIPKDPAKSYYIHSQEMWFNGVKLLQQPQ